MVRDSSLSKGAVYVSGITWKKSSRSGKNGNCVEIASNGVIVRDSKSVKRVGGTTTFDILAFGSNAPLAGLFAAIKGQHLPVA